MSNEQKKPRQYSFVKASPEASLGIIPAWYPNSPYIYLGEIPNMPGYCIVVSLKGKIVSRVLISDFIELNKDEM